MLIFVQRVGQKFFIGRGVTVTLINRRGNQITLGVEAPEGMRVSRGELGLDHHMAAQRQLENEGGHDG